MNESSISSHGYWLQVWLLAQTTWDLFQLRHTDGQKYWGNCLRAMFCIASVKCLDFLSFVTNLLLDCVQAQRVEEVRKMSEQYSTDLKERIDRKMETMGEKREAQLQSVQDRIREHVWHVRCVIYCYMNLCTCEGQEWIRDAAKCCWCDGWYYMCSYVVNYCTLHIAPRLFVHLSVQWLPPTQ